MVTLNTNLKNPREAARTERVELAGTITATDAQHALQDLDTGKAATGATTASFGTLTVTTSFISLGSNVLSSLAVSSTAVVFGNAAVSSLTVSSNETIFGSSTVSSLTVSNNETVFGTSTLSALNVTNSGRIGNLIVTTTATVLGVLAVSSLSVTGIAALLAATTISSLTVTNAARVGSLTVTTTASVLGIAAVSSLSVSSNSFLSGSFFIGTATTTITLGGGLTPTVQIYGAGTSASLSVLRQTTPGAGGSLLAFGSSRGTPSTGINSATQTGDGLGTVVFFGDTGSSVNVQCASIVATAADSFTATSTPGQLSFNTTPSGATATVSRMTIDSAGLVAIVGSAAISSLTASTALVIPIGSSITQAATALTLTASSTSTAILSAATQNVRAGKITTTALTSAANSTFSLLITNSIVSTTDQVIWSLTNGTHTGVGPNLGSSLVSNGAFTLIVNTISALNGTLIFSYSLFK